jgi:hypothetical protein
MATTYKLISSVTVGSGGAATIDFTSIPATYTDLCLVASLRPVSGGFDGCYVYLNNDQTSTRYTSIVLRGNGASVASFVGGDTTKSYAGELTDNTASTFNNFQTYIPNYAGSNQKSLSIDSVGENNATTAYQVFTAGLYNQTTAITQVSLRIASVNIAEHSTAYLYGIKNS